jgi:hypothetical protein
LEDERRYAISNRASRAADNLLVWQMQVPFWEEHKPPNWNLPVQQTRTLQFLQREFSS